MPTFAVPEQIVAVVIVLLRAVVYEACVQGVEASGEHEAVARCFVANALRDDLQCTGVRMISYAHADRSAWRIECTIVQYTIKHGRRHR